LDKAGLGSRVKGAREKAGRRREFWERSSREIARKLSLFEGTVKFYPREGRQKLREVYEMRQIGEKSCNRKGTNAGGLPD
jgi:DNA-directed RNA polymerase specialized sigma24 family protein